MKILPKVVQALVTSTPDATRVRDNLTAAVQPTLTFLNTYFKSATDGTLQVLKNIQTLGQVINGNVAITGSTFTWRGNNITFFPQQGNGFVVIPSTACDPVFYITNPANTDAYILATQAGLLSAVNLSSRAGIKTQISVGEYWNTAPGANTTFQFQRTVSNTQGNALGVTPFVMKWTHPGSVVGMTLNEAGPNTAMKTIYVYKNGSNIYTWSAGAAGNNATFWATFGKGQIPFAAGDTMTVFAQVASTANTQLMCHFTLEMSA